MINTQQKIMVTIRRSNSAGPQTSQKTRSKRLELLLLEEDKCNLDDFPIKQGSHVKVEHLFANGKLYLESMECKS